MTRDADSPGYWARQSAPAEGAGWHAGSLRDWPGALTLADDPSPRTREELRATLEYAWLVLTKSEADQEASRDPAEAARSRRRLAIASARLDVVDLLTRDWQSGELREHDLDELLADLLGERRGRARTRRPAPAVDLVMMQRVDVLDRLLYDYLLADLRRAGALDATTVRVLRREPGHHFWCGLLAALARHLARGIKLTGELPTRATELLVGDIRHSAQHIPTGAATLALVRLWEYSATLLPVLGQLGGLSHSVHVLALFSCAAPESHPSVRTECLAPLPLSTATTDRLASAFGRPPPPAVGGRA